ncbi:NIL domain-containing protein [Sphingobacterium sp. LRF_L2]|uniref:NIL domain-containing protein n=1 Tax=Sphingobacterium sp. LRF_L2 TaxID=3369421 RepID=UPI003F625832
MKMQRNLLEYFPVVEVELKGNVTLFHLLSMMAEELKIPHRLLKAEVEFIDNLNFGHVILHLMGSEEQFGLAFQYFLRNKIVVVIKDYMQVA